MESEKGARKALNYDRHKFYNRQIKVTLAVKKEEIETKRTEEGGEEHVDS